MRVELITGPPGSGKSTLARERMRRGDALLDMDRLWVALTGLEEYDKPSELLPVVQAAAREAAREAERLGLRLVMIQSGARRSDRIHVRAPGEHQLTVLETPPATCLARIAAQQRAGTTDWKALVEQWWRDYQRPGADEGWKEVEVLR